MELLVIWYSSFKYVQLYVQILRQRQNYRNNNHNNKKIIKVTLKLRVKVTEGVYLITLRWERFLFCCLWHTVRTLQNNFHAAPAYVSVSSLLESYSCCFCSVFFQLLNGIALIHNAEFSSSVALPSEWLKKFTSLTHPSVSLTKNVCMFPHLSSFPDFWLLSRSQKTHLKPVSWVATLKSSR